MHLLIHASELFRSMELSNVNWHSNKLALKKQLSETSREKSEGYPLCTSHSRERKFFPSPSKDKFRPQNKWKRSPELAATFSSNPIIQVALHFVLLQTPYYWPSRNWAPENTDYAVYLCKRYSVYSLYLSTKFVYIILFTEQCRTKHGLSWPITRLRISQGCRKCSAGSGRPYSCRYKNNASAVELPVCLINWLSGWSTIQGWQKAGQTWAEDLGHSGASVLGRLSVSIALANCGARERAKRTNVRQVFSSHWQSSSSIPFWERTCPCWSQKFTMVRSIHHELANWRVGFYRK